MTINELIEKYGDKFFNNKLASNHNITLNDVNNEIICQKYDLNSLNVFSNYGLLYENNEPIFLYNKIDRIEVFSDKLDFDCKGGYAKINCFAFINVFNGDEIYKVIKHKINPLYSFDGCDFNYINNIAIIGENHDFNNKIIKINARYGYNGILYTSSINICQLSNYESDWINGDEEIVDIIAEYDKERISNSGGEISIKIYKNSTLNFYKKDCFGDIISVKKISEIFNDITDESILLVNKPFNITNENKIKFPPQDVNSPVRVAYITFKYKNFEKQIEIYQDKGPVVSYESEFKFYDGNDSKIIKLNNCLNTKFEINILSYKTRFLDGTEHDKIYDNGILINKDADWVECGINDENMSLEIIVTKNTTNSIRKGTITLINKDKKLYLHISQPPRLIINYTYDVLINCEDELYANNLTDYSIIFKPLKKIYYDDGTFEIIEYLDPFDKLDVIYNISDDNILITNPKMIDFNGTHESKLHINNKNNNNDINVKIKCRILDNELNQISDVREKNIIIHFPILKTKNIEININVTNKNNYTDVSSTNNPRFRIFDSKNKIIYDSNINRFWVNQYMKNDLVYNCNVNLIEGETYNFNVEKYFYLDKNTKDLSENYIIEDDDIGIDLNIDI